jgi:hypothetical protein
VSVTASTHPRKLRTRHIFIWYLVRITPGGLLSERTSADPNFEAAQRIQEKFDAYFLALIFTLLGASIQTAKFGFSTPSNALELLGWLLLLIAGLSGLSYLEWMPRVFRLYSLRLKQENEAQAIESQILQGKPPEVIIAPEKRTISAEMYLAETRKRVQYADSVIEPMERRGNRRYGVMKWCFVAGLIAVIAARGWVPASELVRSLRGESSAGTLPVRLERPTSPSNSLRDSSKR